MITSLPRAEELPSVRVQTQVLLWSPSRAAAADWGPDVMWGAGFQHRHCPSPLRGLTALWWSLLDPAPLFWSGLCIYLSSGTRDPVVHILPRWCFLP